MKTFVTGLGVALIAFSLLADGAAARSKKNTASSSYCKDVTKVTESPKDCPGFR